MFIDASALVAVLLLEATAQKITEVLEAAADQPRVTNVIAVWETVAALQSKRGGDLSLVESEVERLLKGAEIETLGIAPAELPIALAAYGRYGRHRRAEAGNRNKALNIGDCFHYSTAKSLRIPIVTIDEGFALTDLDVILIR